MKSIAGAMKSIARFAAPLVVSGTLLAGPSSVGAWQQEPGKVGAVLIAHGGGADWNRPVIDAAAAAETGGPVAVSFLMGDSASAYRFQDAVASVVRQGAERVVVVPLLASSYGSHYEQIRYLAGDTDEISDVMMHHLHMAGIERASAAVPITLAPALDASPEIADILSERALALATNPAGQAVFIVGHGPNGAEDHAAWMANLRPIAEEVGARGGFRDVKLGLVRDDAPEAVRAEAVRGIREVIELQNALTGADVVVVPILVSKGHVSVQKLPRDLAGLPIVYDGEGLLPHEAISRWIERRVREATPGQASNR